MSDDAANTGNTGEAVGPSLDRLLRGASLWRVPEEPAPDDEVLVAYLSGALSPAEVARTQRGLVAHAASRRRLRDVAARLDALQATPWGAGEQDQDTVARAWRTLTAARLGAATAARRHWAAGGWAAVRAQATAGAADAQAAWTAFLSFADQWDRERRLPRLAEARGPATVGAAEPLPSGVTMVTEAAVGPAGELTARAWVRDSAGQPSAALDGRTARLALAAGGDAWPLADAEVRGGEVGWSLPGGGSDLGLEPGPLSGLSVTFGDAPPLSVGVRALYARSTGEVGDAATRVELWGPPRREAGRLRLALALPALTRAAHAGCRLAVSVAVMPSLSQRLGDWLVSDWGDAPRSVDAPCPGPDGDFDAATLRLDLEAAPD